jgi:hypothetical protein
MVAWKLSCRSIPENGKAGRKEAKLINGFPYALPMPAPLPRPQKGAARLETCISSDQIRDGTGIGNVSRSAWWLPTQADILRAQVEGTYFPSSRTAELHMAMHSTLVAHRLCHNGTETETKCPKEPRHSHAQLDGFARIGQAQLNSPVVL